MEIVFWQDAAVIIVIIIKLFPILLWIINEDVWMLSKDSSEAGRLGHEVMVLTCTYSCQ